MKTFLFIIGTLISLVIALLPEAVMVMVWRQLDPHGFFEKVVTFMLFGFFGLAACFFFGVCGLALWGAIIKALDEVHF